MPLDEMDDLQLNRAADSTDWSDAIPELEWDDTDAQSLANELTGRRDNEY